jgi:hypothetical protein
VRRHLEAATMLIPDPRVAEVVALMTDLPEGGDSLDMVELIVELEDEFGEDTVRRAHLFIEASAARRSKPATGSSPGGDDPLWDRDLDG